MRLSIRTVITIVLLLQVGCSPGQPKDKEIEYPHYAPPERRGAITAGADELYVGMNSGEVKGILGDPDEINDTYRPEDKANKNAQPIGYSYVYLIQRLRDKGGAA